MAGSATRTVRTRQSKSKADVAGAAANEDKTEAMIRERAYHLWEAEGRPSGRHEAHWLQAEQELGQGRPASSNRKLARGDGAGRAARAPGSKASTPAIAGAAGRRGTRTKPGSAGPT